MKIGDWETHAAADLLPLLEGEAYRQLCASIRAQGLKESVKLYEGKVLDGRNRLRACLDLAVTPRFEAWEGEDPFEHVWALNAERRHLEQGQKAAIRLKFDRAIMEHKARIAEQANRARSEAARRRRQRHGDDDADDEVDRNVAIDSPPRQEPTSKLLADKAGVGKRTAEKALVVAQRAPEQFEAVVRGELSLNKAYQQASVADHPEWKEHEAYYTPDWVVQLLAKGLNFKQVALAVEPCVGGGAIVRNFGPVLEWITCDVRADVEPAHQGVHLSHSWLDEVTDHGLMRKLAKAGLVITNPPFSLAQSIVEHSWAKCPEAIVVILQRRTWHDQARAEWFARHQPDEYNVSHRIRFLRPDGALVADSGGTDNTIHTWYAFSPGRRQPCPGPQGGISRTLVRPG